MQAIRAELEQSYQLTMLDFGFSYRETWHTGKVAETAVMSTYLCEPLSSLDVLASRILRLFYVHGHLPQVIACKTAILDRREPRMRFLLAPL